MQGAAPRRSEELRRLRAALNDADRRVVLIRGGAGVGRTNLATMALGAATADGALTGRGVYSGAAADTGFGPILAALSGVLAAALGALLEPGPVVADLAHNLGSAVAVLHRAGVEGLPPVQFELSVSATDRRGSILLVTDAVLQLVRWLEGFGRPLVLFIDDWRYGGVEAETLLASLLEEAPRIKLLLVERDDAAPCALTGGPWAWAIDLRRTRASEPGAAAAQAVAREGGLSPSPDLASLAPGARRTALALACWGGPAPRGLLATALQVSVETLDGELRGLADGGLITLTPTTAQLSGALDETAPEAHGVALAQAMAERLREADAPEVGQHALELRLTAGLDDADPELWRERFASGAAGARARLDPAAASRFGEAAWRLRERRAPQDAAANRLILREAVLAAAEAKAPQEIERRARLLFGQAETSVELGGDYALAIGALRSAGDADAAWRIAREGLRRFGVTLPERAQPWRLAVAGLTRRWRRRRRARGDGDQPFDGLTYVAQAAGMLGHERNPVFAVLIAFLCAPHAGRSPRALAFWLSIDSFLSAIVGNFEQAARLGEQALGQITDTSPFRAATLYRAHFFGEIWVKPLASLRAHGPAIYRQAVLEGDLGVAANAQRNDILIGWRTGPALADLRREAAGAERELRRLGDTKIEADVALTRRVIEGLLRWEGAQPVSLDDPDLPRTPLLCLELASLQGDWRRGEAFARRFGALRRGANSHPGGVVWRFHETLARLKTGRRARRRDLEFLQRAARLNPADHRPKLMILHAEALRARGRLEDSLAAYAPAVDAAEAAASPLEAGLAAECAAAVARAAGRADRAAAYDARALRIWRAWGAVAKVPADPLLEASAAKLLGAEREARARARLLAEVSHELRTPLQGMQGLLDLAAGGEATLDVGPFRDMFGSLKRVVDDLTDFGALTSGEIRMEPGPVSIAALIRAEAGVYAALAEGGGGRLEVRLAEDIPPTIETDGARVRQVLRNLLSNACKYAAGSPITVSGAWRRGRMTVTVEDSGLGLAEADLRLIFEPFHRGALAGEVQGLGLGLALSRRVAEQLGGGLTAENGTEGGARFTFVFPAPALESPTEAASARPSLRILLCEDAPLISQVLSANLRRVGHEVTAVADGAAAWRAWRAAAFDVAILDWRLPGLGGALLVERLAGGTPVLVLTASSDLAIDQQARAAGARQVLRKPVSAAELAEAVAALGARTSQAPADDPAFAAEMARLQQAADHQVAAQAGALVARWNAAQPLSADDVHRLAGLAAQFGHAELAAAADAVEASLRGPGDGLAIAVSRLASAAQSASAIPSKR